jgi:predicted  nucleic acid-binding Zn-ribbon protein
MKKDNEIKLYKGEIDAIREDADRQRSKLKAIELYATELQRKNDLLSRDLVEKNNQIREMESTDWTKKAQITGVSPNHFC